MGLADNPIRVKGLRDFQAALKQMDGESQKMLRLVLNDAAEVVATGARRLVPRSSGRAAASLKVASSQREAKVKGGGARASYYPWLDFGGRVGVNKSVHRPFLRQGRFIFPTYSARRAWVLQRLERGLVKLAEDAGLEVS